MSRLLTIDLELLGSCWDVVFLVFIRRGRRRSLGGKRRGIRHSGIAKRRRKRKEEKEGERKGKKREKS